MLTIFEREFRREKNLEIAKKMASGELGNKKKKPVNLNVDPEKEAAEKETMIK